MTTEPQVRYFLGAHSPHGFYSLYDQLIDPAQADAIYILKGGAGCGKSSLMKRVAQQAEAVGQSVEYLYSCGDSTCLDAVLIPGKKIALIDGTAPHVVEPKYPGLVEHYINLEEFYDSEGLAPLRAEIIEHMKCVRECRSRAYHCLNAAAEIEGDLRSMLVTPTLEERIVKRTKGILVRELKGAGKGKATVPGAVRQRFLSGITGRGPVCFFETADQLCQRVYELADSYGFGHIMLTHLLPAAVEAGYDVVACPSPMAPDRLEHLLIPELSLAFLTSSAALPYDRRPARRIRLDAMVDSELFRRNKPRLRFSKKVSGALVEEAATSLRQADAAHEELVKLYNPHVDFSRVYEKADVLAKKLF